MAKRNVVSGRISPSTWHFLATSAVKLGA
ncbi:hypothetical protein CCACVL1_20497 [Corchorus capsularis]|uniref:Uncharacterized protein n=1 Tax=Corchorus capsularis TaxID=210143 RepID=A0A1R3HAU6_COCAP|nr:hypothetical protein CCACVL1_20497 [Corchorus capsularis]